MPARSITYLGSEVSECSWEVPWKKEYGFHDPLILWGILFPIESLHIVSKIRAIWCAQFAGNRDRLFCMDKSEQLHYICVFERKKIQLCPPKKHYHSAVVAAAAAAEKKEGVL